MTRKLVAYLVAACAALMLAPAVSSAATFTVDTATDATIVANACTPAAAVGQTCSLREALAAAFASPDAEDRVSVPAGNFKVTAGQLEADSDTAMETVTVTGAGARSTIIDAQGASRVLQTLGGNVVIEDLAITGGAATVTTTPIAGDGGGILATSESLTLNRVAVEGNTATQSGGGVAAPVEGGTSTSVTINSSSVSRNAIAGGLASGRGGGVDVTGDLAVNNSTIAGNSVDAAGIIQGGGLVVVLDPLETDGTTLSLFNTTIAGNSTTTGGTGGGLAIVNPTMGVETALTVTNTIIAGNTSGGLTNDCSLVAAPTSENNLSSDANCQFTDDGSIPGTSPALLGSLQDNGGPTDTIALQEGSPAIDAGVTTGCPATDQRGVTRPQRAACDIGAFECAPEPVTPDPVDPDPTDPYGQNKADLTLKIKSKPKRPKEGKKLAFKVKVKNLGPATATDAVLKGTVPASTRKITGQDDCVVKKPKGKGRGKTKFTCQLGDIASGKTSKLKVRAVAKGKLKAKAKVSSPVADPNRKNNKAKAAPKKPRVKGPS